ncbi:hypothetical protein [Georgenia deserti]|uniref:Integral membrane protein n=1 Tax=Georgenia deserti TaxID=2093781 RepID=A0ABW4L684_9MICO
MTHQQGADQPFAPQQGPPSGPPVWHSQSAPAPWGSGGRDRSAPWAIAGVIVLAASMWSGVLQELVLRDLDFGFTQHNVFWVMATAGVWATAAWGAAAAIARSGAVLVIATVAGGLHLLTFAVIIVVQTVLGAYEELVIESFRGLALVAASMVAVVLGFLAWRRDRAGRSSAVLAVPGLLLALAATVASDLARLIEFGTEGDALWLLATQSYTLVFFVTMLLLGLRSAVTRWIAVAAALTGLVLHGSGLIRIAGDGATPAVVLIAQGLYTVAYLVAAVCGVVAALRTRRSGRV